MNGETNELGLRVATAALGGALLLALVIYGGWPGIFFVTAALSLAMTYEFASIVFKLPDLAEKRVFLMTLVVFIDLMAVLSPTSEIGTAVFCFLVIFTYFLFTATRYSVPGGADFSTHFKELMYSFFGLVYLAYLPLFLPRIHKGLEGVNWTLLFLLIVWCSDTGAYFAGKRFGTRKLYPLISPKKTIEGAVGAFAAAWGVAALCKLTFFHELTWMAVLVIPLVVGGVSQIGDLCESFLKRAFEKKDSGQILPGHGGFLDRFDGVVFSLPIMYACIRVFG